MIGQGQLAGDAGLSLPAAAYDLDLSDAPPADVDRLHADGKGLFCCFSAGSVERWRPDADAFPGGAIGLPLDGWSGARWLDARDDRVRDALLDRERRVPDAREDLGPRRLRAHLRVSPAAHFTAIGRSIR